MPGRYNRYRIGPRTLSCESEGKVVNLVWRYDLGEKTERGERMIEFSIHEELIIENTFLDFLNADYIHRDLQLIAQKKSLESQI